MSERNPCSRVLATQCVICPQKGGRVEYVNTCMKELFIVFYHRVEQCKRVGRTLPTPPANHTLNHKTYTIICRLPKSLLITLPYLLACVSHLVSDLYPPLPLTLSINQSIKIYIAPLQDPCSEVLPTQAKQKRTVVRKWWNCFFPSHLYTSICQSLHW